MFAIEVGLWVGDYCPLLTLAFHGEHQKDVLMSPIKWLLAIS